MPTPTSTISSLTSRAHRASSVVTLAHTWLDNVDRYTELEEDAQRCELPPKRDEVHILLSPHSVSVKIAADEVVEVVDSDFAAGEKINMRDIFQYL